MQELSSALLQEITHRLVDEFEPEEIVLFGSHAWGTPHTDSDLDLMVVVSQSDVSPVQRAVCAHRCLQGLDVSKDILVRTRQEIERYRFVKASLEHRILNKGTVLYERQAGTRPELAPQSPA